MVKSPGVPASAARSRRARSAASRSGREIELGWRLLPGNPVRRRHRHERQDDDGRAARRDVRAPPGATRFSPGTSHTPLSEVALTVEPARGSCASSRASSSRTSRRSRARSPCCSTSSPTISTATGRSRRTATRSSDLRARAREGRAARASGSTGSSSRRDDPLPAEPLIRGAHNRENAAAATAAARAAGLGDEAIAEALRTFPGVPHRLELVRERRGVRYVNDSKATNTAAARRGVAAYDAPLHVIFGGSLKGEDFGPLAAELPAERALHPSDRRGDRRARRGARRRRPRTSATATSRRAVAARARARAAGRRRPALAGMRELRPVRQLRAARRGVPATRRGLDVKQPRRSSGSCSSSSRSRSPRSGSSWCTARRPRRPRSATATRPGYLERQGDLRAPRLRRCSSPPRAPTSAGCARSRRRSSSPRSCSAPPCS